MAAAGPEVATRGPDFAEVYSRFSAALTHADLPKAIVEVTTVDLLDTLACSIAGVTASGVQEVRDIVSDWGGKPEALIWWSDRRVPARRRPGSTA